MSIEYEHTFTEEEKLKLDKYKQYYIKHTNTHTNQSQFEEGQIVYTYNNYTCEKLEEVFRHFQFDVYYRFKAIFHTEEDRDGYAKFMDIMDDIINNRILKSMKETFGKFADVDRMVQTNTSVEFKGICKEDLYNTRKEYYKNLNQVSKEYKKSNKEELLMPKTIRYKLT